MSTPRVHMWVPCGSLLPVISARPDLGTSSVVMPYQLRGESLYILANWILYSLHCLHSVYNRACLLSVLWDLQFCPGQTALMLVRANCLRCPCCVADGLHGLYYYCYWSERSACAAHEWFIGAKSFLLSGNAPYDPKNFCQIWRLFKAFSFIYCRKLKGHRKKKWIQTIKAFFREYTSFLKPLNVENPN